MARRLPPPLKMLEQRNGEIYRRWVGGQSQQSIADEIGFSLESVNRIVMQWRQYMTEETVDNYKAVFLEQLNDMRIKLAAILDEAPHKKYVGDGKIVKDLDGNPAKDHSNRFEAAKILIKTIERQARLLGTDAPTQSQVNVTEEASDAAKAAALSAKNYLEEV